MREINKSDNPLIYQILFYGNLGFPEQLKDSCQKNRALILGTIIILLISVVVSFILYWTGYAILGVPVSVYTGVLVENFRFSFLCWMAGVAFFVVCLVGYIFGKICAWFLKDKKSVKKEGKISKLREEFKESYKSFKEKYCEEIRVIDDKTLDR